MSRADSRKASNPPAEPSQTVSDRPSVQWLTVLDDQDGQRLDNFLLAHMRSLPKSAIYRMIRKGEVRVNKGRAKPVTRIRAGDEIRIPPVSLPTDTRSVTPGKGVQQAMNDAVVFEDDALLVVNKPSGIAVHGGSGLEYGLIEALRAARPESRFLELVHRIDRDTSGLVLIAKKRPMLRYLQEEFRQRRVKKTYHALVAGDWPAEMKDVREPLMRYELASGERRVRVDAAGKPSRTEFRVLGAGQGYSLVAASPHTGRTHQIRVHCLFAGHPIAGDDKYMDDASLAAFQKVGGRRLMLHAQGLRFERPNDGGTASFEAPYEASFQSVVDRLIKPS